MASHGERVLAAILNEESPRRDLLAQAVVKLTNEHFSSDMDRNIFRFLNSYYDRTGEVMPRETFVQALEDGNVETAKVLAYSQKFAALASSGCTEADFRWSVDELRAQYATRQAGTMVSEAVEILERGYEVNRQFLQGTDDMLNFLQGKIHEIQRQSGVEVAPEGNVFIEHNAILEDYLRRKNGEVQRGILTGISAIDDRTDGWQPGELIMVVAYAGMGKSQIVTQAAWDCAVNQKKNVFFATRETLRDQVMRRILARHSRLPQFNCPNGINSADIKKGTLTKEHERVFRDVLEDWTYNSDYGQLNVVQIPSHTKLTYVENRLREYSKTVDVAVAIDDYLALHDPIVPRGNEREEFNDTIRAAKGIATDLEIPFVSPWQIRRESYEAALRNGYYTKASLADTSEAEKSADQIIAILREEENNRDMRLQFLKMRDDEVPPITQVAIDLRSTYIGAHAGPQSLSPGASANVELTNFLQ